MKNIYCIVGPSGCGKTTLTAALAEKYGYKVIESYTTRPPRFKGEKGHIFVSPEEFKSLSDKYAYNVYDGFEYGITGDLIKENDLYVVEPSGVVDLLTRYRGEKGIKVFGLNPGVEVLVERMQERGDSDEKIVRRLAVDSETFQGLDSLTDVYFNKEYTLEELCENVHSRIEDFEYVAQHEFLLMNEYGKVVSSKRCNSMNEALAGINKAYPEGLPKGWTVRDDTEKARENLIKAIRKVNPKLKTSHIYLDPTFTDFSWYQGAKAVPFKYGNKQYVYYESFGSGDAWIRNVVRDEPNKTGVDILAGKIDFLYKKTEKIDKELTAEYEDGETDWAAQLEFKLERIENAIPYLEKALEHVKQKSKKPSLDSKITNAVDRQKKSGPDIKREAQPSL